MEKEQLVSLVTKAQQGDNEALNCLFNEFYNDLYYFALKTVKDDETALDVTQEAFVEIINTLGNLKEPAAFVTWAKQITYHQCTRYFKKKKDVLVDEDEEGNTVFDTLKEEKAEFIPDEALDKADFKKTVMGILDELSEEQRSAVMMYYFDEMSVKQIAEIQDVSEGTVKSRLNYARKAIKNSVEEYEKKHNIKLHAIPFFPFLKWIFDGMFEGSLPTASAEIIAEGVGAATGTTVTVATTTATATTVATTTTAGAVGLGAKIAAMPIVTKVIAGIVATAIVIGGGTTAVLLSQKDNTPTSADSQIDYSYRTEYMTSWNYEQALNYYHGWLNDFDMPYFNSVDEVSVDVAVRFGYSEWAGTYQGEWDMDSIIGDQKALLKAFFGREFDFTKLTGEYATYNAEKGIVTVNKDTVDIYNADSWRSDTGKPIDNGDGTYSIIIRDYRNKVNTLPDDIKDGEYVVDEENGGYFTLTHSGRLTIEKKDGFWVLKSYTKADLQSGDGSSSETTSEDTLNGDQLNTDKWNIITQANALKKLLKSDGKIGNTALAINKTSYDYKEDYTTLQVLDSGMNFTEWYVDSSYDGNKNPVLPICIIEEFYTNFETEIEQQDYLKKSLQQIEDYIFYEDFAEAITTRRITISHGKESYEKVSEIPEETLNECAKRGSSIMFKFTVEGIGTVEGFYRINPVVSEGGDGLFLIHINNVLETLK